MLFLILLVYLWKFSFTITGHQTNTSMEAALFTVEVSQLSSIAATSAPPLAEHMAQTSLQLPLVYDHFAITSPTTVVSSGPVAYISPEIVALMAQSVQSSQQCNDSRYTCTCSFCCPFFCFNMACSSHMNVVHAWAL